MVRVALGRYEASFSYNGSRWRRAAFGVLKLIGLWVAFALAIQQFSFCSAWIAKSKPNLWIWQSRGSDSGEN
jgi:hypothetical protein